jgi:hypothetical protein
MSQLVTWIGITIFLSAIAVPAFIASDEAEHKAQVSGDLRRLSANLTRYFNDTGVWPRTGSFAYSDGAPARDEERCFGLERYGRQVSRFLTENEDAVAGWDGPYIRAQGPDPWGHRYVLAFTQGPSQKSPQGLIVSAGPDGIFQTQRQDASPQGDDLGLQLR